MRTLKKLQAVIGQNQVAFLNHVVLYQDIDAHHTFELVFRAEGFVGNVNQMLGEKVKLNFGEEIGKKNLENNFIGVVTDASTGIDIGNDGMIVLRGKSPTILLDGARNCRSFANMNLGQIVNEVLKDYPQNLLNREINPKNNAKIPYIVQYQESDYGFISRIAAQYGEWFYFDGSTLIFGDRGVASESELNFRSTFTRAELSTRLGPVNFYYHAYDYIKNKTYGFSSAAASVSSPNSHTQHGLCVSDDLMRETRTNLREPIVDKGELEAAVTRQKTSVVNSLVLVNGTSDLPSLRIGHIISIMGVQGIEGKYLVTALSHTMDSTGNYENRFEAVPASASTPPVNPMISKPVADTQIAVVTDNKDPEGLGRIRVKFIWDQQSTPWLRVLTPHAGEQHGFYVIPEIDDQVLVGFEYNNPDCPFVFGSLYHGNAKPNDWQNQKNNVKAFRSKSGNEITFIDENGKEEIRVFNKDAGNEIVLSLSGEGKIVIHSKGTLELSARHIKIEAEQSLQCRAKGDATMEASSLSIKSTGKMEIDGGGLAEIKAGMIKLN